jgi:hypothetical protein
MEIPERTTEPFPQHDGEASDPLQFEGNLLTDLQSLRQQGAAFIFVPRWHLGWLQWKAQTLQDFLEIECEPVFRDGTVGVVYAL